MESSWSRPEAQTATKKRLPTGGGPTFEGHLPADFTKTPDACSSMPLRPGRSQNIYYALFVSRLARHRALSPQICKVTCSQLPAYPSPKLFYRIQVRRVGRYLPKSHFDLPVPQTMGHDFHQNPDKSLRQGTQNLHFPLHRDYSLI